ncbi:hypothetical protein HYV81_05455 [Candidatus Woesearchaeota archaeon]|nr:hypothetical protein [Candidatus Woesearchaeota archaeon]
MGVWYTDVASQKRETAEGFFADIFGRARIESGQPSNRGHIAELEGSKANDRLFEEDVNMYLIHGLSSLFHPATLALMRKYVLTHHSDLATKAEHMPRSQKYLLNKVNGDFLLLTLGLFGKPSHMALPEAAYIDRGQTHYAFAAGYRLEIDGGRTAIVDILEKLTINFRRYVDILRDIRNLGILPMGLQVKTEREFQQTIPQDQSMLESKLQLPEES